MSKYELNIMLNKEEYIFYSIVLVLSEYFINIHLYVYIEFIISL